MIYDDNITVTLNPPGIQDNTRMHGSDLSALWGPDLHAIVERVCPQQRMELLAKGGLQCALNGGGKTAFEVTEP
jgi:hypothetical protein